MDLGGARRALGPRFIAPTHAVGMKTIDKDRAGRSLAHIPREARMGPLRGVVSGRETALPAAALRAA